MSNQLPPIDPSIQSLLDSKGFTSLISDCKIWLENKEEHLRAYSPEDKEERMALRKTIQDLENALSNYQKT